MINLVNWLMISDNGMAKFADDTKLSWIVIYQGGLWGIL